MRRQLALALALAGCAQGAAPETSGGTTSGSGGATTSSSSSSSSTSSSSSSGTGGSLPETCGSMTPPICQEAVWDGAQGKCVFTPVPDGMPCSDGDDCTIGDLCVTGACVKGPDKPSPSSCQASLDGIQKMPPGTTTLSFDACAAGCSCCAGASYPVPTPNDCVTCSIDATLAAHGITRTGGLGTVFVDCITGNANAPLGKEAIFAGGATVELTFAQGVKIFGFAALPSSGDSAPDVTLQGYTSDGLLVGTDAFTYTTPGGDCGTSNPAARFFGFRACCGKLSRVVITFSDANTVMDTISFW